MMTRAELKAAILESSPSEFCRRYLFDQDVWIFEPGSEMNLRGTYHDLKYAISNCIDIAPNNVAIVGSGKMGFSLNPSKSDLLPPFNNNSDIDLVIVSPSIFNEAWRDLRTAYLAGHTQLRDLFRDSIFVRFLVLNDKIKTPSTYLRDTLLKVTEMKRVLQLEVRLKRQINYRVYADWGDVEAYHAHSAGILQRLLQGPRGDAI
jgi:hypothetical protein